MKRCFYTIADNNNLKYAQMMANSLKKFHPDIEVVLFGEEQVKATNDPHFYYRATPALAKTLFDQGFDEVCKLDADTVITGNLDHIWEEDFDVAVVNNSNPREDKAYPVRLWNINPLAYVNCGFVVMKSKAFVEHWLKLCMSEHFLNFQYREQDMANLLVYYFSVPFGGPYKVKFLDDSSKWHGLIWKGYEPQVILRDNKLILPKNNEWPKDEDKELVCWHVAGGNTPNKLNYRLKFKDEVIKYLDTLVKI